MSFASPTRLKNILDICYDTTQSGSRVEEGPGGLDLRGGADIASSRPARLPRFAVFTLTSMEKGTLLSAEWVIDRERQVLVGIHSPPCGTKSIKTPLTFAYTTMHLLSLCIRSIRMQ